MARLRFVVEVDEDPMPGGMHGEDTVLQDLQMILDQRIGHYNPTVTLAIDSVS